MRWAPAPLLALPLLAMAQASGSPPLVFSNAPALVDGRLPAPNVFVALAGEARRSSAVATALHEAFTAVADGQVRLAWQAAPGCVELPDSAVLCGGRNAIRVLDDGHRSAFDSFVAALADPPGEAAVSAAPLLQTAQTYLRRSELGANSPWAATPGRQAEPILRCRKAYVLLADETPLEKKPNDAPPLAVIQAAIGSDNARQAMRDAMDTLLADSQTLPGTVTGSLAASTAWAAQPGATLFAARYGTARWSGEIAVRALEGDAAPWGRHSGTALPHSSASLLDARDPDTRVIVSSRGHAAGLRGIAWRWDALSPTQQSALDGGQEGLGPQRLAFLRGDRTREAGHGGPFRDRASRQADSVNARLWHAPGQAGTESEAARPPMLYLGGNGGMLHAFDATTGAERFAYVPQGVVPQLAALTRPHYTHRYFVDGSPFTADVFEGDARSHWLFGFLGAGGKGYFAVDVRDLAAFATEDKAAEQVRLDTTVDTDPDLGHIFSEPVRERGEPTLTRQVTRLNDGRWALLSGNGYNSERQRAVLLIQYLDGARELRTIVADGAGGNGLSAPRLVDTDGDGVPDIAYAGDLRGQLWKFDLGARSAADWAPAFGGKPFFIAQDANGKRQPITSAPLWLAHPGGGRMVVVGTGRLLTEADRGDTATQSIYGLHDKAEPEPIPAGRGALVRQAVDQATSKNAVADAGGEARRGWYIDLPVPGERVTGNPHWFEGKLIDITSTVPPAMRVAESCDPAVAKRFRTTVNAIDGARPRSQLYSDAGGSVSAVRIELGSTPSVPLRSHGKERAVTFEPGTEGLPRQRLGYIARRPSWRQLQ